MDWLTNNPISTPADVRFLLEEVERVKDMIVAAQQEHQSEEVALQDWRGNIPYLRLIHCLAEDNIKPAYLRRHYAWSRQRLDARNSEARPPTVYEQIADLWNAPSYNPSTEISDCHSDYSSSISLAFSTIQARHRKESRGQAHQPSSDAHTDHC